MGHNHAHTHHHHAPASLNAVFILCIVLNLLFVCTEAGVGFMYHSLGLLSDAGHNLSDVFSLLLSLMAIQMAKRPVTEHFTYGYKKSTILVSLANAIILLVAIGAILLESVYKLRHPEPVSGEAISWTAGVGIVVNGITAWLLMKQQKGDLNVRGAFLHMAMDTLVSVGVVVSGIIIMYTGWVMLDAIISLAIVAIIFFSTWRLLKESLFLSMDAVPESVDLEHLKQRLSKLEGIESWHHLHVWAVSTTENAATIHVVLRDISQMETLKRAVKELFREEGVQHSTVECESIGVPCVDEHCH